MSESDPSSILVVARLSRKGTAAHMDRLDALLARLPRALPVFVVDGENVRGSAVRGGAPHRRAGKPMDVLQVALRTVAQVAQRVGVPLYDYSVVVITKNRLPESGEPETPCAAHGVKFPDVLSLYVCQRGVSRLPPDPSIPGDVGVCGPTGSSARNWTHGSCEVDDLLMMHVLATLQRLGMRVLPVSRDFSRFGRRHYRDVPTVQPFEVWVASERGHHGPIGFDAAEVTAMRRSLGADSRRGPSKVPGVLAEQPASLDPALVGSRFAVPAHAPRPGSKTPPRGRRPPLEPPPTTPMSLRRRRSKKVAGAAIPPPVPPLPGFSTEWPDLRPPPQVFADSVARARHGHPPHVR
jgi:hypothetical protein